MKLNMHDLFDRGTMTMQMEDIVDTLTPWQALRLWLFCRQTRSKHRSMFGVDWTRSEQVMVQDCKCDHCEPEHVHCPRCGDRPEHCPDNCWIRQPA